MTTNISFLDSANKLPNINKYAGNNNRQLVYTLENKMLLQGLRTLEPEKYQLIQSVMMNAELTQENQIFKDHFEIINPKQLIEEHSSLKTTVKELQAQLNLYKEKISEMQVKSPSDENVINNEENAIIIDLKGKLNSLIDENIKLMDSNSIYQRNMEESKNKYDLLLKENHQLHLIIDQKSQEAQIMHNNLLSLEKKNEELQKIHAELQMNYPNADETHQKFQQSEINSQQNSIGENESIITLDNKNENSFHSPNKNRRQHEVAKKSGISGKKLHELNISNSSLVEENEKMKGEIVNLKKYIEELEEMSQEFNKEKEIKQNNNDNIISPIHENESLTSKNEYLNIELSNKEKEIDKLKSIIDDLENRVKSSNNEIENLKKIIETMKHNISSANTNDSKEKKELMDENKQLKAALHDCLTQIEQLNIKIHEQDIKCAGIIMESQKVANLLSDGVKEVDIWRTKYAELEGACKQKNIDYENKIIGLLSDIEKFTKIIDQVNEDCACANAELLAVKNENDQLKLRSSQTYDKIARPLADEQIINELKQLNDKIQMLEHKNSEYLNENQQLKLILEKEQRKKIPEDHDWNAENQKLQDMLKLNPAEIDIIIRSKKEIEEKLNILALEKEKLGRESKAFQQDFNNMKSHYDNVSAILRQSNQENEYLKNSIENLQKSNRDLKEDLNAARTANEMHLRKIDNMDIQFNAALNQKSKENQQLNHFINELEQKINKLVIECEILQEALSAKNNELENIKENFGHNEANAKDHGKNALFGSEKVIQHGKTNLYLENQVRHLDQENQSIKMENLRLKSHLNEILEKYESVKKLPFIIQDLEKQCSFLRTENHSLLGHNEQLNLDLKILRQKLARNDKEPSDAMDINSKLNLNESENFRLQQLLDESLKEIGIWKDKYLQLEEEKEEELAHWKKEKDGTNELIDLKGELTMMMTENKRLTNMISEYKKELDDLRKSLRNSSSMESTDITRLQRLLLDKDEEIIKKNKKVEMLEQENKLLKRR